MKAILQAVFVLANSILCFALLMRSLLPNNDYLAIAAIVPGLVTLISMWKFSKPAGEDTPRGRAQTSRARFTRFGRSTR